MKGAMIVGGVVVLVILGAALALDVVISRASHDLSDCFGQVYSANLPTVIQLIQDQKDLTLPTAPSTTLPRAPDALYGTASDWANYQRAYDDYHRGYTAYQQVYASYQTRFNTLNQRWLEAQRQVNSGLQACVS